MKKRQVVFSLMLAALISVNTAFAMEGVDYEIKNPENLNYKVEETGSDLVIYVDLNGYPASLRAPKMPGMKSIVTITTAGGYLSCNSKFVKKDYSKAGNIIKNPEMDAIVKQQNIYNKIGVKMVGNIAYVNLRNMVNENNKMTGNPQTVSFDQKSKLVTLKDERKVLSFYNGSKDVGYNIGGERKVAKDFLFRPVRIINGVIYISARDVKPLLNISSMLFSQNNKELLLNPEYSVLSYVYEKNNSKNDAEVKKWVNNMKAVNGTAKRTNFISKPYSKAMQAEILKSANSLLGTKYEKLDCSSFVSECLYQAGASTAGGSSRSFAASYEGYSPKNFGGKLEIGDVIFMTFPSYTHVALYVGNGNIVHSLPKRGVVRERLSSYAGNTKLYMRTPDYLKDANEFRSFDFMGGLMGGF